MAHARVPTERADCLALYWPARAPPKVAPVDGIRRQTGLDEDAFKHVQSQCGFSVSNADWNAVVATVAPAHSLLLRTHSTPASAPVACAVAHRREDQWFELGWIAVVPPFRRRGLGHLMTATLVQTLTAAEHRVFLSTLDTRVAALRKSSTHRQVRIYLKLGFHPVFRADKVERWKRVCRALEHPFTPELWRWPDE